ARHKPALAIALTVLLVSVSGFPLAFGFVGKLSVIEAAWNGGFLPLILAGGGFWPPFAMAIAGGVLLSAIVSFYFVPSVYSLLTPARRAEKAAKPGRAGPLPAMQIAAE
ncbi:MAG: proton-conducting transporter membrane subunit, partial [Pseudomonadota bacterium]